MNKKLLFSAILLAMVSINEAKAFSPVSPFTPTEEAVVPGVVTPVSAVEDVTAQYLTNADFEGGYDKDAPAITPKEDRAIYTPDGWTVERTGDDEWDLSCLQSDDLANSSFSAYESFANPTESMGTKAYWARLRWVVGSGLKLYQNVTLPKGWYRLSADAQTYAAGNSNSVHIFAGENVAKIANTGKSDNWGNRSLVFYSDGTEMAVGFEMVHAAADELIAAFDNFKLESLGDDAFSVENPSPNIVANGEFGDGGASRFVWTNGFEQKQNFGEVGNQAGFTGAGLECWAPNASLGKLYHTIYNLPAGIYQLKMKAFGRQNPATAEQENLFIYAGSDRTQVISETEEAAAEEYTVTTTFAGGDLEIGLEQPENAVSRWVAIDDVELVYMGPATNDAAFATLTQSLEAANSLLDEKMGVAALEGLNAAIAAAKDITSSSEVDDINAAKVNVDAAVAVAKTSVAKYAALKDVLDNDPNAEDAERLDATGKAKYDELIAEIAASYENGTFDEESDINALLKNILLTGARAQTSDDADYTLAVEDYACSDPSVWKMVTALADGCKYQYDTWAGEASGLSGNYLEYWIYRDNNLSDAIIENVVDGLAPGTYRVSMEIAVNNERTLEDPTGVFFYVNNDAQEITGLANTGHGGTAGEFSLEAVVGEDGKLVIGFSVESTTANWLAFKNCKVSKVPTATGINAVKTADGAGAVEVARYNAAGMKVSGSAKGLNIVKMSDGTVRKVILK